VLEGRLDPKDELLRVYVTVPRPPTVQQGTPCPEHARCRVQCMGPVETHFLEVNRRRERLCPSEDAIAGSTNGHHLPSPRGITLKRPSSL
jgi:hypothetical protein